MTKIAARVLSSALLIAVGPVAFAQEQATTPGPQAGPTGPAPETWHAAVNPYGSYTFDADFHDTGASVSVTRAGLSTDFRAPLSPEWHLTLGLVGEYSNYDFNGVTSFLGSDHVRLDLLDIQVAPGVEYKLSDAWSVFGGVLLESAGDAGADVDQSTRYGGYVGLRHKVSDALSYTFGVGGRTQLEDDPEFFPVLGLDWNLNPGLTLSVATSAAGGQVRLSQALAKSLAVSVVTGYESRQYRLDDQPFMDGVMLDNRIPVGLELAWRPNATFSVRGTLGYVVWQEIEFDNSKGYELTKKHPDAAPYVGVAANWQF